MDRARPYGYLPTGPARLQTELENRGLKLSAGLAIARLEDPASWPGLEEQIVRVGELLVPLGARYLFLVDSIYSSDSSSGVHLPESLDGEVWKHLIESTNMAADLARDRFGLQLTLHPCADSHIQYEDEIEAVLEQTDPDRVSLCLDTGHHAYRGGDPVEFMRRHHERIPYLHLKSVDGTLLRRVNAENITLDAAVELGIFCEPVKGSVDFEGFAKVLREIGFHGIATVEQDMLRPLPDVPLPIARRSLAYYRDVGIG